jgi:hypothetical protein
LGTAALASLIAAQLVIVEHRGCSVVGVGRFNAEQSIYSDCGDFVIDPAKLPGFDVNQLPGKNLIDITTQGFTSFPIRPLAIEVTDSTQSN